MQILTIINNAREANVPPYYKCASEACLLIKYALVTSVRDPHTALYIYFSKCDLEPRY